MKIKIICASICLDELSASLRNIDLRLMHGGGTQEDPVPTRWWEIREDCTDDNYLSILKNLPYVDCSSIILYAFNDKVFPATLNIITAGG